MKENSIEEDIKDIEKYISFTSKRENFSHDTDWNWNKDLANKIEHILSAYQEVLKEANRYKNMYKAEHKIHLVRNEQLDRKENAVTKCNELIIENAKLKEENEELKNLIAHKNGYTKKLEKDLFENCNNYVVTIQKVKDKIEELKQEKKKYGNCLIEMYEDELVNRDIKILQELLESEE